MNIRKAIIDDLSRVAEIYVFNNRINFFPIFKDEVFSFGELQVVPLIDNYFKRDNHTKYPKENISSSLSSSRAEYSTYEISNTEYKCRVHLSKNGSGPKSRKNKNENDFLI